MSFSSDFNNQRRDARVKVELVAQISIGSQLTLNGRLKDLSHKSAFIVLKHSVYLQVNDEVGFLIQLDALNKENVVQGSARISRIAPGEGLAIYFTEVEAASQLCLKKFLKDTEPV